MLHIIRRFARILFPPWTYEGLKIAIGRELSNHIEVKSPLEMHGTKYGGWCISTTDITASSVVYSFGIGEDLSFDLSLIQRYGVRVHAFDPTPESLVWASKQNLSESLVIHAWGLAAHDGVARLFPPLDESAISHSLYPNKRQAARIAPIEVPVKRLSTIMRELGHDHIDILKIDIEGTEYEVIEDIIHQSLPVSQLLIEFHHFLPHIHISRTRRALEDLRKTDYRIFYIDPHKHEFSLIKKSPRPTEPRIRR